jgi:D-arabinose 1-dehydrogenase-like Zn-dependent alcohol dehydrogenase
MRVLGVHVDGGMREFITVPVQKLHKSETLSLDQQALVETLCIGAHAVNRAQLENRERVLVIGRGADWLSRDSVRAGRWRTGGCDGYERVSPAILP